MDGFQFERLVRTLHGVAMAFVAVQIYNERPDLDRSARWRKAVDEAEGLTREVFKRAESHE